MFATSAPPAPQDPHRADAIARAERRRAVLERLTEIGMALAEEIAARTVQADPRPEPRHDPCRAYAAVSRAVRLTVALEARIESEIVALRNGGAGGFVPPPAPPADAFAPASEAPLRPRLARVRAAVWEAINREVGDVEVAAGALDRTHERLAEAGDDDPLLAMPFRDGVAAICADLGLEPDWSGWSDDVGFPPNGTGPQYKWQLLWAYDRGRAEERRQRFAAAADPPRRTAHGV